MNLTVENFIDSDTYSDDVSIDKTDLDSAVTKQSAIYAHYSRMLSKQSHQAKTFKTVFEVIESKLYRKHKLRLMKEDGKATDKAADAAVKSDPVWFQAYSKLNEAEALEGLAKNTLRALEQRKDMLVQICVGTRKEKEGAMSFNRSQEEARGIVRRQEQVLGN